MNYQSLPTIEQANLEQFWDVVRTLDPELYLVKIALMESGVNPMVLPKVIRQISNLAHGTGSGQVRIFIEKTIVTTVKGEETDIIKEEAIVDNNHK